MTLLPRPDSIWLASVKSWSDSFGPLSSGKRCKEAASSSKDPRQDKSWAGYQDWAEEDDWDWESWDWHQYHSSAWNWELEEDDDD